MPAHQFLHTFQEYLEQQVLARQMASQIILPSNSSSKKARKSMMIIKIYCLKTDKKNLWSNFFFQSLYYKHMLSSKKKYSSEIGPYFFIKIIQSFVIVIAEYNYISNAIKAIKIIKTLLEEFQPNTKSRNLIRMSIQFFERRVCLQYIDLVVKMTQTSRNFREEDIPAITEKLFQSFDVNRNQRFTKRQFPKVMKKFTNLIGGEQPHLDDVEDLFNLLDVNGDETIDRSEFKSLIQAFFKVLAQRKIDVRISKQADICL